MAHPTVCAHCGVDVYYDPAYGWLPDDEPNLGSASTWCAGLQPPRQHAPARSIYTMFDADEDGLPWN